MKAILFDLDGTLIDSSEGITKSVQYALQHWGIEEPDLVKLQKFIGPPLDGSFRNFYGFSQEDAKEAVKVYRERYVPIGCFEVKLYPHVKEALMALKAEGYMIALASSKPEALCRKIMTNLGIADLFDEIAGATEDGRIGTKQEVLLELFRRIDVPRDEMVLVGDTIYDIEGANQVGIASIGVTFGFGDIDEMKQAGAKAIISDMMELPEVVKQ